MQNKSKKIFFCLITFVWLFLFCLPIMDNVPVVKAVESTGADNYAEMFSGGACACKPNETNGKQYVRMQLAIPGITQSCINHKQVWKDGKTADVEIPCHYVEANLPEFIKTLYNFSIGIIAIIAVMIIMISGLRWILAGGNPGQITAAKEAITAAVSGLILALLSYAILNTINPNLTNLQVNVPGQIKTIEQASNWCKNLIGTKVNGEAPQIRLYLADTVQGPQENWFSDLTKTQCNKKYEIKDITGKKLQTCWGYGGCPDKQFCYQYSDSAMPFCYDAQKMCEQDTGKDNCSSVDSVLQNNGSKYVCGKRYDRVNLERIVFTPLSPGLSGLGVDSLSILETADKCILAEELKCPEDSVRVNCMEGPPGECYKIEDNGQKYAKSCNTDGSIFNVVKDIKFLYSGNNEYCVDTILRGAKGVNSICCKKKNANEYKCVD